MKLSCLKNVLYIKEIYNIPDEVAAWEEININLDPSSECSKAKTYKSNKIQNTKLNKMF